MRNIEKTKTFTHIGHKTYETHTKDKQTNKNINKNIPPSSTEDSTLWHWDWR